MSHSRLRDNPDFWGRGYSLDCHLMGTRGHNEAYLDSLILKALADAWAKGLDHENQVRDALASILQSRPELSSADVLAAIRRLQNRAG